MNGALNDLRFNISDDLTIAELRDCYTSFLNSVVHEVVGLIENGSFSTESDMDEWLGDFVDTLEHVSGDWRARMYMGLTHSPNAHEREISPYARAQESAGWYQMAFHAQMADLRDALLSVNAADWFKKDFHAEASRYDYALQ